jgi:ketosteroid isomerase-like protein
MSQENVEVVRRGYERYSKGDAEWVSTLFSEKATGTLTGPAGFLRSASESVAVFDDFHVEVADVIDAGDAVIALVRISGKGRASGALLETHLAHLWVFGDDGKVIRGEVHRSTNDALQAVGLAE